MKSVLLYCLFVFYISECVFAQTKKPISFVNILKKSATYDTDQKQTYPAFDYQGSTDSNLTDLRITYHLDSVAGTGNEVERALRLLDWFHKQVPHEDAANITDLTAKNIILLYRNKKVGQGCYPLSIAMNEVFLSMGFRSRSVILFSGLYPTPDGGHVANALYIVALSKWIFIDPQENAYIKDEKGHFLSVDEVRQRLIDNRPLVLNATANYHGVPTKAAYYLYQFIAQHIYRIICPLNSEYNSQTRMDGKLLRYVELLPKGSQDPAIDMFETSIKKDCQVITYHTNNNQLFWQKP